MPENRTTPRKTHNKIFTVKEPKNQTWLDRWRRRRTVIEAHPIGRFTWLPSWLRRIFHPTLQDAIDSLPHAGTGGTVWVKHGDYNRGTSQLLMNINNLKLLGAGKNAVKIVYTGSSEAVLIKLDGFTDWIENFKVADVGIDVTGGDDNVVGLRGQGARYGVVSQIKITGDGQTGSIGFRLGGPTKGSYFNDIIALHVEDFETGGLLGDSGDGTDLANANTFLGGFVETVDLGWHLDNAAGCHLFGTSVEGFNDIATPKGFVLDEAFRTCLYSPYVESDLSPDKGTGIELTSNCTGALVINPEIEACEGDKKIVDNGTNNTCLADIESIDYLQLEQDLLVTKTTNPAVRLNDGTDEMKIEHNGDYINIVDVGVRVSQKLHKEGDIDITDGLQGKGLIVKDKTTGTVYRIIVDNGSVTCEAI